MSTSSGGFRCLFNGVPFNLFKIRPWPADQAFQGVSARLGMELPQPLPSTLANYGYWEENEQGGKFLKQLLGCVTGHLQKEHRNDDVSSVGPSLEQNGRLLIAWKTK